MRLTKKQWLFMQILALLLITGGFLALRPHLARAVGVSPSSLNGSGVAGFPYEITNCEELQGIGSQPYASYKLMNDIDCSATSGWNSGRGFTPIGNSGSGFRGNFNGYGHSITDLYIDQSSVTDANVATALFGIVDGGATLLNFKVAGATIISGNASNSTVRTGGVVAGLTDSTLDRIHFSGTITMNQCNGAKLIGGISGEVGQDPNDPYSRRLTMLSSEGTITVNGANCGQHITAAGGIFGEDHGYKVSDSYSTMDITINGDATQPCPYTCRAVGGILGEGFEQADIDNSYYAGSLAVTGGDNEHVAYQVGGLIGYQGGDYDNPANDSDITDSFAAPQISVPAPCANEDCGTNDRNIGAIVGDNDGTSAAGTATWSNVYYDQFAAGTTHCADNQPSSDSRCTAVNTDGLDPDYFKGANPGAPADTFDYYNVWETTNSYPILRDGTESQVGPPTDLAVAINSATSLNVSWTAPTGPYQAWGYQVLCRVVGVATWSACSDYTSYTSTSTIITGLIPSTQYEIKVVADGGNVYWGTPSDSVFATTATLGYTLINTCQDLQNIQNDLADAYELAHDIDCSDTVNWNNGAGFKPIANFDPIGSGYEFFSGILKGNNYSINNLYIDLDLDSESRMVAGLFSATAGSVIQDVNLNNPVVNGGFFIGSTLVGYAESTTITNVHANNATVSGGSYAKAGLVGFAGNNFNHETTHSRNSFTGTITSSMQAAYTGGLYGAIDAGSGGGSTVTESYAQADITMPAGSNSTGGIAGLVMSGSGGYLHLSDSYVAGSITVQGAYQTPPPIVPDIGITTWAAGGIFGILVADSSSTSTSNIFAHTTLAVDGPQDTTAGILGYAYGSTPGQSVPYSISTNYFDADQAGTTECVAGLISDCNVISGQPDYFKNNSTNPPLDQWDFTNVWMATSEFPVFGNRVTSGISTTPTPNAPNTSNCITIFGVTKCQPVPPVISPTNPTGDVQAVATGTFVDGKGNGSAASTTAPADEVGVLGAIKHFVRNLPAAVVVGFPYALFFLLGLAAIALLIELGRELRRLHLVQVLLHKQQLLAEERDAFWHLAANYLRAPVTLIVGGAEALHDAAATPITVHLQTIAADLQTKIAAIMAKIEGSTSLQAISQTQAHRVASVARRAIFIIPVATVAILATLGNYAAASYRNMSPGALGYAAQFAGFILVSVLFYWVLGMLTRGKAKRQAAEAQLARQTEELASARHELILDTAKQLNPDLTVLEGTLKQLSPEQSALEPTKILTEGTSRLREIVNSFAMLIKVQEGVGSVTASPETSAIDLTGVLTRTRAKLTPQITAKGVRVVAPAIPLAVHAEADMANQVLESIISNAVDYSPANGTVKVEAKRLQDAIQIRVSDQGQGIDKKQLDHLFQPFVRADGKSAMDMSHGGFGINLYLDKLIMEQLGGSISAASTPGQGTAITMTWPTA